MVYCNHGAPVITAMILALKNKGGACLFSPLCRSICDQFTDLILAVPHTGWHKHERDDTGQPLHRQTRLRWSLKPA